jgi:hypothetical protein
MLFFHWFKDPLLLTACEWNTCRGTSEKSTVQKEVHVEPLDQRSFAIQAHLSLFVSDDIVWLGERRTTSDKCQHQQAALAERSW